MEALKSCVKKLKEQKKDLFAVGDNELIFLQFGFKKISLQRQMTKVYGHLLCLRYHFCLSFTRYLPNDF